MSNRIFSDICSMIEVECFSCCCEVCRELEVEATTSSLKGPNSFSTRLTSLVSAVARASLFRKKVRLYLNIHKYTLVETINQYLPWIQECCHRVLLLKLDPSQPLVDALFEFCFPTNDSMVILRTIQRMDHYRYHWNDLR